MDILIIKNDDGFKINKNIGLIFRRHNIVEYKSPHDYLSIDDYYKILAYAYVYKSDSAQVDQIKIEDITVSFVTAKFPRKLINHLKATYSYDIVEKDKGIYYLVKENNVLPIQFILTTHVDPMTNMWLSGLTNNLTDRKLATEIMREYRKNSKNKMYRSIMYVILKENPILRGGDFMDDDGLDLLEEFFKERLEKMADKLAEAKAKKLAEAKAEKLAEIMVNEKVAEKVAQNATILAEKDRRLAEKDAEIIALKAQLKAQSV